jgi:hypothetical protein
MSIWTGFDEVGTKISRLYTLALILFVLLFHRVLTFYFCRIVVGAGFNSHQATCN